MHGDREIRRPSFERHVDRLRIRLWQVLGVVAVLAEVLPHLLVAEIREAHVVELQIAAAGVVEMADRLAVGRAEIGPELVELGIEGA